MDLDSLRSILEHIESRAIRTVAVDTAQPSVFSHEILNANPYAFLDDAPLEERRARAVVLRRTTRTEAGADGILDPAAISEVSATAWPLVRDAEELHDALLTLTVTPPAAAWADWFGELATDGRAAAFDVGGSTFWTAAERLALALTVYPAMNALAPPITALAPIHPFPAEREPAFAEVLRGWLESSGPASVDDLAERFAVEPELVFAALVRLETEGQVLRGRFRGAAEEWCNRRILARIHQLTIGRLRREIEPVSTADYVRFLFRWQHVAPSARLHGVDGTLHIIRQLEGYEIPAAAWESSILPARIAGYRRDFLDQLCYAGDVMWGRLTVHPMMSAPPSARARRIRPTKLAPIALFMRDEAAALIVRRPRSTALLSHAAQEVVATIAASGAPFFADIVRATKRLPAEVEEALWELVAAGLVTADGFDALRSLTDRRRRLGDKGHRARPRSSSGRWTILDSTSEQIDADSFARRLLQRWGVVFRDVAARETLAPRWREILIALRRLESRGDIRGGRFVAGYTGEQFALPEAIEALRAARRSSDADDIVEVSAYDPLQHATKLIPGTLPRPLRSVS